MRTHNKWVVSSSPACVPIKTSLVRKATGNHLINSTSLEETQSRHSSQKEHYQRVNEQNFLTKTRVLEKTPSLLFVKLRIEFATQLFKLGKNTAKNEWLSLYTPETQLMINEDNGIKLTSVL